MEGVMMGRRISFVAVSGLMLGSCVYGLFYHVKWAENVFLFLAWASVVVGVMVGMSKDAKMELRAKGRSVPAWLSIGIDVVLILATASVGRFALAAGLMLAASAEYSAYNGKD